MATSGQVNTNTITTQSGVKWYMETNWSVSSWNGNTATISWSVYLRRSSGSKTQVQSYGVSGNVNGHSWSKANGSTMYKDTQYGSGTFTLNGGGSVTAQVSGNIYGSGSNCYVSANQTWTLDNNVVAPTLTCSIGTRTETSIASSLTITNNGNATITSKSIELFTNSTCTNKVGTITGDSGTFTGLTANTTYYARAKAYNGTHTGYSSVITTSTYQYPYISAVETTELTIGNSQKLTLYNPLGRSVTIQMYQNPTIYDDSISVFYSGTTSGTSITFTPNASKMYQTIPTETNSTCSYSCKYGSSTKVTTSTYKYKVKGNNQEAPNFSNFSFVDGDSSATALTGATGTNPSIMVKGLSDANFTITTSNKATSNYYAELDYYRFTWTNSTNKNYEANANVTASVTNGSSTTLSVTAYDKRGQNKSVSKTITLISPSNAVASLTTKRRNGIEAVTYLNGTISYWSGDWANGSSRPNQLIKVEMSPNNGTNKYDITSSITSHSSSATNNNVTTLTLATDTIQIHANGSSGGFVVGTAYNLTFYITTGYSSSVLYENSALGGTASVTSGKIGLARFKDSSGNYHYSIGKIPTSNYAFDVLGNTYCEGDLSVTGEISEGGTSLKNKYASALIDSALVGQSSSTTTNPWYKFASCTTSGGYVDKSITFKVSACYGDASKKTGILTAHIRTDGSGYWASGELFWEYASSGINASDFVLAHNASSKPTIAELWVKQATAYQIYHFDVLTTGTRDNSYKRSNNNEWTLYITKTAGSQSAITSGYTQIASTIGIANATILKAVYPVGAIYMSVNSTNPNTLFGFGTWEQLKDRFLVGAGNTYAVNGTGGATTHTHPLSSAGHADISYFWTGSRNRLVMKTTSYSFTGNRYTDNDVSYVDGNHNSSVATPLSGKTDSGSTLPPYLAVYMWKRTA